MLKFELSIQTRSVPRTICELASRKLLHEKHSFSLQSRPHSWELHLLSGGCIESAVSPVEHIAFGKMNCETPENQKQSYIAKCSNL